MIAFGWLAVTVALYVLARRLHGRVGGALLSPLVVVPVALVAVLVAFHVPYRTYMDGGGAWLGSLLSPAIVAFAIPLHRHRALLRAHAIELGAGVLTGSVVAIASSVGFARWLRLGASMEGTLAPRSITTPLAMQVAADLGGVPALTAVFVILTGVFGAMLGAVLVRRLPLRSPVARGALFGTAAHGAGTAQAMQLGAVEGAIAGLAMILAGLLVLVATPALQLALRA